MKTTDISDGNNVLVCVYAHQDDESFLFGGTLAICRKNGIPVSLICVMDEATGTRTAELNQAAKVLGVDDVRVLGYKDGELHQDNYHKISSDIKEQITSISREYDKQVDILTLAPNGVTGHVEHIFVTMVATHVFYQLPDICKKLMYFCKSIDQKPTRNPDYFVYSPPGYPLDQIDESYDISSVWDIKRKAILCHTSQITDQYAQVDSRPLSYFNPEHFIVHEQDYKGQNVRG
jgi:LmbE family N-acetylglucosaminyl deacetylase